MMRLTLRTLLAYMDDILEPADSQFIAKKLEESEFATNLMHRIRDVTRRLRLAAPKLDGRGVGLDPNTVAEYLDNTLSAERVADFEKVCLDSEIHLAEVASCHQILALVLGEPAEIDPAARERMYGIVERSAAAPPVVAPPLDQRLTAEPVGPIETAELPLVRKKPEVPEYLREATVPRPRRRLAGLVALALFVILGGLGAAVQLGYLKLSRGTAPDAGSVTSHTPPPVEPAVIPPLAPPANPPLMAGGPASTTSPPSAAPAGSALPVEAPSVSAPVIPEAPAVAGAPPGKATTAPLSPAAPAASTPPNATPMATAANAPAAMPGQATASASPPATASPTAPAIPSAVTSSAAAPAPGLAGPAAPSGSVSPAGAAPAPGTVSGGGIAPAPGIAPAMLADADPAARLAKTDPKLTPATPEGIGRLTSEREVLLRFDPASQTWRRLATRAVVYPGDVLTCLPAFRANLTVSGVSVQMLSSTTIELLPSDTLGVPGVKLLDGRVMILPQGKPQAEVRVVTANCAASVMFVDADSILGLEQHRQRLEGTDPEKDPGNVTTDAFVAAGNVRWTALELPGPTTNIEPLSLRSPARLAFANGRLQSDVPQITENDFPQWIKTTDERTQMEKRASEVIDQGLGIERPITLGLTELASDRRIEVSTLAVQCLARINDFDAFVTSLNDPSQKVGWNAQVEALRAAIARGPQAATRVRESLEHHRGSKGLELYRMIWGYSPDQLQQGAAAQLVKWLNHEDLDFRVLAFWNLSHITNSTHFYRPEYPAAKRALAIKTWEQKLESGQLFKAPTVMVK